MSRHSGAIRSCVNHTGPPDALKGDAPHAPSVTMASQAVALVAFRWLLLLRVRVPGSYVSPRERVHARCARRRVPIIGDASDGAPRLNKTTGTWGGAAHRLDPPPSRAFVVPARAERRLHPRRGFRFRVPRPRDPRDPRDCRRAVAASPLDRLALAALSDAAADAIATWARLSCSQLSEEQRRGDDAVRSRRRETATSSPSVLDASHTRVRRTQLAAYSRARGAHPLRGAIAPGGTWQDGYKAACCVEAAAGAGSSGRARLAEASSNNRTRRARCATRRTRRRVRTRNCAKRRRRRSRRCADASRDRRVGRRRARPGGPLGRRDEGARAGVDEPASG